MTIERPMFPPRAGKPALRLVGGIESTPPETESRPAPRKPKARGPYKQQARKSIRTDCPSSTRREKKIKSSAISPSTGRLLPTTTAA